MKKETRMPRALFVLGGLFAAALAAGCDDGAGGKACDPVECDDVCQGDGFPGGVCQDDGECECVGAADAGTDTDADTDTDSDGDSDSDGDTDTGGGFEPTPGTQASVDRTEPCDPSTDLAGYAPQDGTTFRYCFPNYNVWAPLPCGDSPYDLPDDCDEGSCGDAFCLTGETAKWVGDGAGGGLCPCFNLCTAQESGARCGASDERPCIPIDNAEGQQVFICGAEL